MLKNDYIMRKIEEWISMILEFVPHDKGNHHNIAGRDKGSICYSSIGLPYGLGIKGGKEQNTCANTMNKGLLFCRFYFFKKGCGDYHRS